jgi:hypothetical protein
MQNGKSDLKRLERRSTGGMNDLRTIGGERQSKVNGVGQVKRKRGQPELCITDDSRDCATVVMPAQAGIQTSVLTCWIPAFAGMT